MKKVKKIIPKFKNEEEEIEFWAKEDSADYLDWSKAKKVIFPKLKPSTKTTSLRLPVSLLNRIRIMAHKRDIPYQTFIKILLDKNAKMEK